jgi:hypothetical protein
MAEGLYEGKREGVAEDKVVRGGARDGPASASIGPKRSETCVTVLGIPTPLGMITETAVYILRKRERNAPSSSSFD